MNERPHLTLAQFLKIHDLVGSGGQAKHRVRVGDITVDGVAENRPGRKLYGGERVVVDGEERIVEVRF